MNENTTNRFGMLGILLTLSAGCSGIEDAGGTPPVGQSESALDYADPAAEDAADVAHLARISDAVLSIASELPAPQADAPQDCTTRQLGCMTFEPCPEGAMGTLIFADDGCAIPGTGLALEGSITLVELSADPAVVEVSFEDLTLRGDPASGGFRIEGGEGSSSWSFTVVKTLSGDSISGSGTVVRDAARTTTDVTISSTQDGVTRELLVEGLTIADGAEMPDGGSVAAAFDPALSIPEESVPEDLNGDGRVSAAEQIQRALLLETEVSELGVVFLATSPTDGRVEVYLNDPENPYLTACVDTDSGTIVYGPCA